MNEHDCCDKTSKQIAIIKDHNKWGISDDYPYHLILDINYCPFCGIKLE